MQKRQREDFSLALHAFIVDEHDEALAAQHTMINWERCPSHGVIIQHFDAHPDLTVPPLKGEFRLGLSLR